MRAELWNRLHTQVQFFFNFFYVHTNKIWHKFDVDSHVGPATQATLDLNLDLTMFRHISPPNMIHFLRLQDTSVSCRFEIGHRTVKSLYSNKRCHRLPLKRQRNYLSQYWTRVRPNSLKWNRCFRNSQETHTHRSRNRTWRLLRHRSPCLSWVMLQHRVPFLLPICFSCFFVLL